MVDYFDCVMIEGGSVNKVFGKICKRILLFILELFLIFLLIVKEKNIFIALKVVDFVFESI